MNRSVITSRTAEKDYQSIITKHADILKGINEQKIRVDLYNQQREQEAVMRKEKEQQGAQVKEQNDQKMTFEREKLAQESQFKEKEYDIKLMDALKET